MCFSNRKEFGKNLKNNLLVFLFQDPPEYQMLPLQAASKIMKIEATANGKTSECYNMFYEEKAYSLILNSDTTGIHCNLVSVPQNGFQNLSFCNSISNGQS